MQSDYYPSSQSRRVHHTEYIQRVNKRKSASFTPRFNPALPCASWIFHADDETQY